MARTATPAPVTSASYWRKALARVHPDAGGSEALFVWLQGVREALAGDAPCTRCLNPANPTRGAHRGSQEPHRTGPEPEPSEAAPRIPFDDTVDFDERTAVILHFARDYPEPFASVLALVGDCYGTDHGRAYAQQYKGATYKQLAAIAHTAGMSKDERVRWYRVAEEMGISQRHAHHILTELKSRTGRS